MKQNDTGKPIIEEVSCFHLTGEQLEAGTICPECGYDPNLSNDERGEDLKKLAQELKDE